MKRLAILLLFCGFAGGAYAAVEVEIGGLADPLAANVRETLSIVAYANEPELTEAVIRRLHNRAPAEIREALMPFGHYEPVIEASLERRGANEWRARYTITPGPPVRLAGVEVRLTGAGADDPALAAARTRLPLVEGAVLRHADYADAKLRLQAAAQQHGYLDARFTTHVLRVYPAERRAEVELVLDTGPRFYFGPVRFEQSVMDEAFLRRYLGFQPGDPFNVDRLLDLQFALMDSEYYALVEVEPLRAATTPDNRVPIRVHMTPREKHKYSLGLGYGTDTGPRLSLGWDNRRVNRRGHHSSVNLRFSEIQNSLLLRYFVPLHRPQQERIIYSVGAVNEELGDGRSEKRQLGIARVTVEGSWQQTAYLQFERERSLIAGTDTTTDLMLPGVTWSRTRADSPVVPDWGWRVSFDLRGGSETLGSDSSFLQGRLQLKWVAALGEQTRLLSRFEYGATRVDATSELPLSQRFFAGGDQSVRGFGYQELGPRDAAGNVLGGRFLGVGSVELERRFRGEWSDWGLAVFVDSGNAANQARIEPETAAGLGLRWKTPVGMLRVDVARPLSVEDAGWRLHLSIGPDL